MVGIELRRAGCRWRVTKPALSIASWDLISTMATFAEGTGVLSKTPECLIQLRDCDQVSDRGELPFRIFLGEFSYSVDVCEHIVSSSVSRYVSFQQIRTLASPFPPVGSVAAPCGSPAVPHLHRYYGVVRLLQHPSVLPPVDPWLHVPLDPFPEAVLLV